jgi:hypothetical protein
MFDTKLVQRLCADISAEDDPEKTEELLSLLHAVLKEDQEEIRVRMAFLLREYGAPFTPCANDVTAAPEAENDI